MNLFVLHYDNARARTGKHSSLVVTEATADAVQMKCDTRPAQNVNALFVEVNDWNKALDVVREYQKRGHDVYRQVKESI